jgi:hypothetical protein
MHIINELQSACPGREAIASVGTLEGRRPIIAVRLHFVLSPEQGARHTPAGRTNFVDSPEHEGHRRGRHITTGRTHFGGSPGHFEHRRGPHAAAALSGHEMSMYSHSPSATNGFNIQQAAEPLSPLPPSGATGGDRRGAHTKESARNRAGGRPEGSPQFTVHSSHQALDVCMLFVKDSLVGNAWASFSLKVIGAHWNT